MPESPNQEPQQERPVSAFWVVVVATISLLCSLVPYLIGWSFSNGRRFMWLGYNLDDSCVYLSWLRQAADGSTRALNMFTTESQHGMGMNPLFWFMGIFAHVSHLPLPIVLHVFRIAFGATLLAVTWQLIKFSVKSCRTQQLAFLFVCFGSGLGWMPGLWPAAIDAWQPEAITYLSIYLSPLFCFSLTVQVLAALFYLRAIQSSSWKLAIAAGVCVFVLGMTHTYDVISMLTVFGAIALFRTMFLRAEAITVQAKVLPWIFTALASAIAAPSVLYILHELNTESVFHKRMEVKTYSGPIGLVLIGYGLLVAGAVFASYLIFNSYRSKLTQKPGSGEEFATEPLLALVAWMIANVAVSYLPVKYFPFQRKMLQGAHIPIAILAAVGCSYLFSRVAALKQSYRWSLAAAGITLVAAISNLMFIMRDIDSFQMDLIQTTHMHRPYISIGEIDALDWVAKNSSQNDAIQPLPWLTLDSGHFAPTDMTLACFTPGLIHRFVYCGHWGETPDYQGKLAELSRFGLPEPKTTDADRVELLKRMKVKYLIFSQKQSSDIPLGDSADKLMPMFRGRVSLPNYLKLAYSNPDADVYMVDVPK